MSDFIKITEEPGKYRDLDKMSIEEILALINDEDKTVALAVEKALPQIKELAEAVTGKILAGGRLFYIASGTSGRLAMVDASECPPTFGVPQDLVIAIIAGGEKAFTTAVEFAEDSTVQGWLDLQQHYINHEDVVLGITSSGSTPYVVSALQECKKQGIVTGCITNNPGSPVTKIADYPVEVVVGPEFVTGSTRMKGGTSQKMVLNMISTTVMIQLGRVEDNKMVHLQLTNEKLIDRGTRIIMDKLKLPDYAKAKELLLQFGSVKKVITNYKEN